MIAPTIFKKHGIELHPIRSSWHLNDREALIKRFEKAGFKDVVAWNQYVPFKEFTEDTYQNFIKSYFKTHIPDKFDDAKKDEIVEEIAEEFKKVGKELKRPIGFNSLVITGTKA